jgi:hypothetical protein
MDKTTTDLEVLRRSPHQYCWGRIIKIHDIGEHYTIIEAEQTRRNLHEGQVDFYAYVDGKTCHTRTQTFDDALIHCIAYRNLEQNQASWMSMAAHKLLCEK